MSKVICMWYMSYEQSYIHVVYELWAKLYTCGIWVMSKVICMWYMSYEQSYIHVVYELWAKLYTSSMRSMLSWLGTFVTSVAWVSRLEPGINQGTHPRYGVPWPPGVPLKKTSRIPGWDGLHFSHMQAVTLPRRACILQSS
jgi:hypothetical protein